MRTRIVSALTLAVGSLTIAFSPRSNAAEEVWRRVAHSEIRHACISDGSARMQHYWDVAAFDWGGVVPLNSWYHPQLFRYRSGDSVLQHLALALPHEGMGNEDDPRMRLAVHRGASAAQSHVMFTIYGYEEIDDENGLERRDTAVMAIRPMESLAVPGSMPRRTARVVNMDPEEAKNGVGRISPRCGAVYDQKRRLVFVPRDRSGNLKNREMLQVFHFDETTGGFNGRQSVRLPDSMTAKHNAMFAHVSSKHSLLALGATTFWSSQQSRSVIYLMKYGEADEDGRLATANQSDTLVSVESLQATTDLAVTVDGQVKGTVEPTAAVIADHDGRVAMIVAGGTEFTKSDDVLSAGLYVFDLGPVGGPYAISAPRVRIPIAHGVTDLEIVDSQLIASARGIHVFDLDEVSGALSKGSVPRPRQVIPLPYDTHGVDAATIDGRRMLFVASGRNGIDTFQLGDLQSSDRANNQDAANQVAANQVAAKRILVGDEVKSAETGLGELQKSLSLATGADVRHLGRPTLNNYGSGSVWCVLTDGREAILQWDVARRPKIVLVCDEKIASLGQPSLNERGEIAVWVGHADGTESILIIENGGQTSRVHSDFRHLSNVRLSATGDVLFALSENKNHPNRALAILDRGGRVTTLFRENHTEKKTLGTGLLGNFIGDFDIASDGQVALVVQHGPRKPHIYSWRSGRLTDHGSPGQHVQQITFGQDSKRLTFRLWKDEVISQSMVDLQTGPIGDVKVLAHRRKSYGKPPANPGDFFASRADSRGNVVFATVENSQSGRGVEILGNQLWYSQYGRATPIVLVKPGDKMGDALVLNARFRDGFSDRGWAMTTLDVQTADGKLRQWMVRLRPDSR